MMRTDEQWIVCDFCRFRSQSEADFILRNRKGAHLFGLNVAQRDICRTCLESIYKFFFEFISLLEARPLPDEFTR